MGPSMPVSAPVTAGSSKTLWIAGTLAMRLLPGLPSSSNSASVRSHTSWWRSPGRPGLTTTYPSRMKPRIWSSVSGAGCVLFTAVSMGYSYLMTDLPVGSMRVTIVLDLSIIVGTVGPMQFFQWSDS